MTRAHVLTLCRPNVKCAKFHSSISLLAAFATATGSESFLADLREAGFGSRSRSLRLEMLLAIGKKYSLPDARCSVLLGFGLRRFMKIFGTLPYLRSRSEVWLRSFAQCRKTCICPFFLCAVSFYLLQTHTHTHTSIHQWKNLAFIAAFRKILASKSFLGYSTEPRITGVRFEKKNISADDYRVNSQQFRICIVTIERSFCPRICSKCFCKRLFLSQKPSARLKRFTQQPNFLQTIFANCFRTRTEFLAVSFMAVANCTFCNTFFLQVHSTNDAF